MSEFIVCARATALAASSAGRRGDRSGGVLEDEADACSLSFILKLASVFVKVAW